MCYYENIAESILLTISHTDKWSSNYPDLRKQVLVWKRQLEDANMSDTFSAAIIAAEEFTGLGYTEDEAMEQICQERDGYVQKVIEENLELKETVTQLKEKVCQLQKRELYLQKQLSDALKKK